VRVIRRLQTDLNLKEMRFATLLANDDSQRWKISDLWEYGGPDRLKAQVEHCVVHGGTCPPGDVAVDARQDEERKSHSVTEVSYHIWSGDHLRIFYAPHRWALDAHPAAPVYIYARISQIAERQTSFYTTHSLFHCDDSWKCCKRFGYSEPVSDREND
jgi:hypothetical protein